MFFIFFFFSSRRRHTRFSRDWSSDVCSSDLRRSVRDVRGGAARVIVRWGLEHLPEVLGEVGIERPLLVARPRWDGLELPDAPRWSEIPSHRIEVPESVDGVLA